MHVHDVVVVGAGPGGSTAAHFLSQRGLDVLLLDRAEFPRDKTCGDGLTPRALRVLDRMQLLPAVLQHGCEITGYEVVAPNGRSTHAPISAPHAACVVPRLTLDHLIQQRAVLSGAHFEAAVNVTRVEPTPSGALVHAEHGRTFGGRLAIVATGAATSVLQRSGILRRQPRAMLAARAYFEDLHDGVAQTFQLRFDRVPMPGYGWIFPTGPNAANVGVGFMPRRRRRQSRRLAQARTQTATQAFIPFVEGGRVSQILAGGHQVGPVKGYPIRVDFLTAPTFAEHTLL
ncbi:MAG: FAD-dependent monooxygenase, partial [Chloroflexi bacterium]|nr:FAD-dependent monooxygenase [Chloroflexota bacterium]